MAKVVNGLGRGALLALGAAALALPLFGAIAQEHDHSAHAHEGEVAHDAEPLTAEQVTASREIFSTYSCGACHVMADAGGNGHIGPALDGNANLSVEYVTQIVSNGQGAMPSFGGMVSEEEIDTLARYIIEAKAD
jgi:mono/diheme cytochrome c family protein